MIMRLLWLLAILFLNALVAATIILYMHLSLDMYPGHQEMLARKCVQAGKQRYLKTDHPTWVNWFEVKRNTRYADVVVSAETGQARHRFICLFEDEHLEEQAQDQALLSWTVRISKTMAFDVHEARVRYVRVREESAL